MQIELRKFMTQAFFSALFEVLTCFLMYWRVSRWALQLSVSRLRIGVSLSLIFSPWKRKKTNKHDSLWVFISLDCITFMLFCCPHRLQASLHKHQQGVDTVHVDPAALLWLWLQRHHQQHVETLERQRWQQVDCVTDGQTGSKSL